MGATKQLQSIGLMWSPLIMKVYCEQSVRASGSSDHQIRHKMICYNLLKTQSLIKNNGNDQLRGFAHC